MRQSYFRGNLLRTEYKTLGYRDWFHPWGTSSRLLVCSRGRVVASKILCWSRQALPKRIFLSHHSTRVSASANTSASSPKMPCTGNERQWNPKLCRAQSPMITFPICILHSTRFMISSSLCSSHDILSGKCAVTQQYPGMSSWGSAIRPLPFMNTLAWSLESDVILQASREILVFLFFDWPIGG